MLANDVVKSGKNETPIDGSKTKHRKLEKQKHPSLAY